MGNAQSLGLDHLNLDIHHIASTKPRYSLSSHTRGPKEKGGKDHESNPIGKVIHSEDTQEWLVHLQVDPKSASPPVCQRL